MHYFTGRESSSPVSSMHFSGDPKYRVWAHDMMTALNKHAKAQYGYSAVSHWDHLPVPSVIRFLISTKCQHDRRMNRNPSLPRRR